MARQSYVIAILIHAALFTAIGFYTVDTTVKKPGGDQPANARASTSSSSGGGFNSASAPFTSGQLQARLSNSLSTAEKLSTEEKLGKADEYASRLGSISSVESMREMGAYFRTSVKWTPPESEAEPGKEKVFDHATSMPLGAREIGDGQYVFVFRDANDNRLELPAAPGDETAAKAFALLDRSEVLRELKTNILLPILNKKLDQP